MSEKWAINGELALSCNCTVFCPCVLSLGKHPPTEGYCQTWAGIRIDQGRFGDVDLGGINVALVMEIPGLMSRGNWTAGLFVDDRADIQAVRALTRIFTGRAGGSTGLLSILVGRFLGVQQTPVSYTVDGKTRIVKVPKIIDGAITPVSGSNGGGDVVITNSQYWIAPDITVCQADRSRMRGFGRNWDFAGRSAELCRIEWRGP
ncbi:hypothetical protein EDC22_102209 [Tepidamorphus gemmatus]|uniref:DUF1326 domain-containing protein n=1 Tax=Tepidamorphus gemmatus TaxID=747076 RepID=A0A4R3MJC2_9HYPH|nr:DUF1326 domain-containing protein [Tepidamorphus gemmatus]TCT12524.1 hypothetical protein EDC22_102209 [Tepidamorphus gemmatus]